MGKRIFAISAAIAILSASCQKAGTPEHVQEPAQESLHPGEYILPLIETTDMHGYIVYSDNNAVHYRLAYIADKAEDLRAEGEDRLLLLDGGDLYQGASISNLMSGWPIYTAVSEMGYDAVALGNHEFDWGIEDMIDSDATLPDYEWEGKSHENKVPVLCANLYKDGNRVPFTSDYAIVEKSAVSKSGEVVPVKIGIIGFAVNYSGSIMTSQFTGKGYTINADFSIADAIASKLESSGQCDATVLLIHGAADDSAAMLGRDSAIDLVLGGHSHRTMSGRTAAGIPYLQGGRYCEHYAYAEMSFTVDNDGVLSFADVGNMAVKAVDQDRDRHTWSGHNAGDLSGAVLAISEHALSVTSEAQNDIIGHINVGATSYYIEGSGERAAVVSNWMCDILRRIGSADVSFVNSGGIRTYLSLNGHSTRDITVADVFEMFPFGNKTFIYNLTYSELLQVFEYSMTTGGAALFSRMTGMDCRFTSTDHGSYKTYAVYSLEKDGTTIYRNGKWTGDWAGRNVVLAVSEYLATTERTDYYTNTPNPLIEWNKTARLTGNDLVDNVEAVRVLRAEAASSGGLLSIDTAPHFILQL